MKKNGFTLVEILISLVILSIITTSITLGVMGLLERTREREEEELVNRIELAICTFAESEDQKLNCTQDKYINGVCTLEVESYKLTDYGYFEGGVEAEEILYDYNLLLKYYDSGKKECIAEKK